MVKIETRPRGLTRAFRRGAGAASLAAALTLATGVAFPATFALAATRAGEAQKLDDVGIAQAIDSRLFVDPGVDANRIDVRVRDGIAELTGSVRDLLSKERAAEIAEAIKGVRAVSNRIEVRPPASLAASEIRKNVETALLRDPATDSFEVEVAVEGNVVTLRGTVQSWAEKELSELVAKGVKGVAAVENELRVQYPSERPDSEIEAEVRKRLDWDVLVDGHLIDVEVEDGKVALTGSVGSAAEKRRAELDAWRAGNVIAVDGSGLEVRWWARDEALREKKHALRSDAAIEQALRDVALRDPRFSGFEIDPRVESGWVTLRGVVDNLAARRVAGQLARNTVGVSGVSNQLKIRLDPPREDEDVRTQVRSALALSPVTEAFQIDVDVEDGWVTLSGTVDSYLEKLEAEEEASKVTGVVAVRNRLEVADTGTEYVVPHYRYPWSLTPPLISVMPGPANTSDFTLRERIERALRWDPFLDETQIDVVVRNGVATLKGDVDSWREYQAATDNAYAAGAVSVLNHLIVAK